MTSARRKAAIKRRSQPWKDRQAVRDEHEGKPAKGSSHKTGGGGPQKPAKPK